VNDEYLDFAKSLAQEAGKIMNRYFRAEDIGTEWKEGNSPLTMADTKVSDLVIERVKEKYPEHGVIGEEGNYEPEREMVWVVDPVDGTIPFSLAMPLSTFSLALVSRKDGQPIAGVIFDPFLDHLYSAQKGKGSWLNDKELHTTKHADLARSYFSALGSFKEAEGMGVITDALREKGAKNFALLSQAYSAARVASGELICSIFSYGSPWDSAAAALIVAEAGGIVTDLKGKPRRYDRFDNGCLLSANQEVHELVLEVINAHYRD
jgi:myo-inositol-1(or 4)-monophosphatase